jgi:outer membrane protein assembly factor BamB
MKDVGSFLERESQRHELPAGSFDRLTRKRDRRRRNQRISAGVVAFAVVVAAFTGAINLLHQSRVAPAGQAITPENVAKLKLLWSAPLDATTTHWSPYIIDRSFPHFAPVVSGGLVLTSDSQGILYAFPTSCSSTCKPAWTAEAGIDLYAPTIVDGIAYVATGTGQVSAYRLDCASDGSMCKPIWTGQAGRENNASPAVSNGLVFEIDAARSNVYAFPTTCTGTCAPSWTAYVGPLLKTVSLTPSRCDSFKGATVAPAISNGVVLAPDPIDFTLHALDAATGRQLWVARPQVVMTLPLIIGCPRASRSGWVDAPVVDGSTVYWAAGASVYGYPESCRSDGGTCRPIWRSMGGANSQPVVSDGVVYVVNPSRARIEAYVNPCHDGRTVCKPLWRSPLPTTIPGASYASLSTTSGRLIVEFPLDVYSLPPRNHWSLVRLGVFATNCVPRGGVCEPEWLSVALPEASLAPVAAVDGVVYMGSTSGQVYAFPETCSCGQGGLPSWTYSDTISRKLSTPAVAGARVYVATGDGRLLAFGLPPQALPPQPPASPQRGAAIFYLAVALAGAAFLTSAMLRKRRRRSRA